MSERVSRRQRILLGGLLAAGGVALAVVFCCVAYILVQPCPRIEPAREVAAKALAEAYSPSATSPAAKGASASRALCRLDALLHPIWGDRLTCFLFAVPDPERRETYYVLMPRHAADVYYVYIVGDGEVMPRAKFEAGGD